MASDTITEESIKLLVNNFYQKIRLDTELSPIFIQIIGEDEKDWVPHLERMYAFWSSIMLSSGQYHGNPMKKHKDIPKFNKQLFERWLFLFAETAHEIHTDDIAQKYIDRSHRIAESLKHALYKSKERVM